MGEASNGPPGYQRLDSIEDWLRHDWAAREALRTLQAKGADGGRLLDLLNRLNGAGPYLADARQSQFARDVVRVRDRLSKAVEAVETLRQGPSRLVLARDVWDFLNRLVETRSQLDKVISLITRRQFEDVIRARVTAAAVTGPGNFNDREVGLLITAATGWRFRPPRATTPDRDERAQEAQKKWRQAHQPLVAEELASRGMVNIFADIKAEMEAELRAFEETSSARPSGRRGVRDE